MQKSYESWRVVRTSGDGWENFTLALLMGVYDTATKKRKLHAFRLMQAPLCKSPAQIAQITNAAVNKPVLEYKALKAEIHEMDLSPQGEGLAVEVNPYQKQQ